MKQQVNLYKHFQNPSKQQLTLQRLVLSYLVFLIILAAIYSVTQWNAIKLKHQSLKLEITFKVAQQELLKLDRESQIHQGKQTMQQQVSNLAGEVKNHERLVTYLSQSGVNGFSSYLKALAQENRAGIWLTNISINQEKGSLTLWGNAKDSSLIPEYVTDLSGEKIFAANTFKLIRINAQDNEARATDAPMSFILSTSNTFEPMAYGELKQKADKEKSAKEKTAEKPKTSDAWMKIKESGT